MAQFSVTVSERAPRDEPDASLACVCVCICACDNPVPVQPEPAANARPSSEDGNQTSGRSLSPLSGR